MTTAALTQAHTRPWYQSYGPGVPHFIDDRISGTIPDLFDASIAAFAKNTAQESFGVGMSYAKLGQVANSIAAWLQATGIGPGDRVAIMMPNVAAYMPIVFGALKAGATVVNVNPLYTPHELTHQLTDSGATTIFVLAQFEHTVKAAIAGGTKVDRVIRVTLGDLLGIKGYIVNYVGAKKSPIKEGGQIDGAIDFATVVDVGSGRTFKPVAIDGEDIAFLQYTGGTTGVAKGAALRHRNLLANVAQCSAWFTPTMGTPSKPDVMVTALPLYHIFALTACCLYIVKRGACALLITNPRDIPGFVKTLKTRRFTMIAGVNTLYNALSDAPGIKDVNWAQMQVSLAGGMATQQAVADKWKALTGKPIIEGYGLSETSPGVCFNRADNTDFTGTVGMPWPSTDVSIRDVATGVEQEAGGIGELCVKGPQVMAGYWNRPDETAKVMTADGYFRTGDLALMKPNGEIKIVDRLKEMVIVSGFNVYPNEVEDALVRHPKVREAAVIGLPDPHSGEAVHAYVVRRDDSLTADELRAFAAETLTKYKCPKTITFRTDLPKSNVGKVLRRALRDEVIAGKV